MYSDRYKDFQLEAAFRLGYRAGLLKARHISMSHLCPLFFKPHLTIKIVVLFMQIKYESNSFEKRGTRIISTKGDIKGT